MTWATSARPERHCEAATSPRSAASSSPAVVGGLVVGLARRQRDRHLPAWTLVGLGVGIVLGIVVASSSVSGTRCGSEAGPAR